MRGHHRFRSKQDALGRAQKVWLCMNTSCNHTHARKPKTCEQCGGGNLLKFDSMGEHKRFCELRLMMMNGLIKDLRVQVPFALYPAKDGLTTQKTGKPVMTYFADFVYSEKQGQVFRQVVEDYKGHADHATDVFKLKKRLIESAYQINIRVTM